MKQILFLCILILPLIPSSAQLTIPGKYGQSPMTFSQTDANRIEKDFRKMNKATIHPRLFYTDATLNRIKQLIASNDAFAVMYFDIARKHTDSILKEPLLEYGLDAAKLRVSTIHKFATQVPYLIFMYQVTGESQYADRCIQQLERMCEYPDWGANRHFLDTGIGAFVFAFVYDGLYHYMTAEQRELFEAGVRKHALNIGKYQIEHGTGAQKWYIANHNWNGICNNGLIAAALAMYETDPDFMSQLISATLNTLPRYIAEFEPDGQSEEGLGYWSYGLMYTVLGFEAMKNVLGTTYGMAETPGIRKTGWFPFLMSGPVASINIGDDPLRNSREASLLWFAQHNNDPALARQHLNLCLENHRCQWQDIYFYQPELMTRKKEMTIPLDNAIRGIGLYSIRENWDSKDALYIAMHGGANNANHGHLDAGSFYIQAMGEVFAVGDLGGDNYTYPGYFNNKAMPGYSDAVSEQQKAARWFFYRLRTEGKNCIVVNPTIRPEQKGNGIAKLESAGTSDEVSSYTLNLSDCYERDVQSYVRTIGMNRKKRELFVNDALNCRDSASVVWWFMHTQAEIELQEEGRAAILTMNGKRLKAEIHSPAHARFQIMPASYLLKDSFPLTRNSENTGFQKLAIKCTNCDKLNLEVTFRISKLCEEFNGKLISFCWYRRHEFTTVGKRFANILPTFSLKTWLERK